MPPPPGPGRCQGKFERLARQQGYQRVAGVDEVGRGALFGPVFAAAVILPAEHRIRGLRDSKQLTAERREILAQRIRERATA
jgi:ribonuclease HII